MITNRLSGKPARPVCFSLPPGYRAGPLQDAEGPWPSVGQRGLETFLISSSKRKVEGKIRVSITASKKKNSGFYCLSWEECRRDEDQM